MYKERTIRSLAKALSWRLSGSLATAALVYFLSGKIDLAALVGGAELVGKIVLYFVHERVWAKLPFGRHLVQPAVIWLTGLSGAGKSTIAEALYAELKARRLHVEMLDGDQVRNIFPATGFTRADRDQHIRRVGFLASKLERNGVFVIASFISPYRESREFVRSQCRQFIEVYLSTPIDVCESRDVKGLYKRARSGEISNFTGVSDPYEPPESPDIVIDTSKLTVEDAVATIMSRLKRNL